MPVHGEQAGAARVRRERKMRSFWRHEQMAIQMVLASVQHHSHGVLRNQRTATRTGGEARVVLHGQVPGAPLPQGGRPAPLPDFAGWQDRVERHVMEDLGSVCPLVQILDLPVPQMVENISETLLRILDFPISEQVIEVPKISCSPCPSRSRVPEPQSAEQLVKVPTVLSPTRIAVQIAEQIVGIPIPQGRGGKRRSQGFLPEQNSTVISSSLERISEQTMEQIVDIPSSGGGLGQGSSSSAGPAEEDFTGVFRTFSHGKKCGVPGRSVRTCPGTSAHGLRRLMCSPGRGFHEEEKEKEKALAGLLLRITKGVSTSGTVVRVVRPGRFPNLPY